MVVVLLLPRSRCVLVHASLALVPFALIAALVISFCLLVLPTTSVVRRPFALVLGLAYPGTRSPPPPSSRRRAPRDRPSSEFANRFAKSGLSRGHNGMTVQHRIMILSHITITNQL